MDCLSLCLGINIHFVMWTSEYESKISAETMREIDRISIENELLAPRAAPMADSFRLRYIEKFSESA